MIKPQLAQRQGATLTNYRTLFDAVKADDVDAAKNLVADGADVNAVDNYRRSPLILAAHRNSAAIAGTLLDLGADANAVDHAGRTALMWAAHWGNLEFVERLLQAPGVKINNYDMLEHLTPMMFAVRSSYFKEGVVQALLIAGANAEMRCRSHRTAGEYAARCGRAAVARMLGHPISFVF